MSLPNNDIPHPHDQDEGKNIDYSEHQSVREIHAAAAREKPEPQDGAEPISLWFVTFCFLVLFCGGYYLGAHSGGFRADVYNELPAVSLSGGAGVAAPKQDDPVARGKKLFVAYCASCHQATGLGQPGVYPSLAGSEKVNGEGGRLVRIVLHGAVGPWQAKSGQYNNAMAAWGIPLTDKKIAQILTYVRQDFGNTAGAISEDQVAAVRTTTAARKTPYSFEEIMAEPDQLSAEPPAPDTAAVAPPPVG